MGKIKVADLSLLLPGPFATHLLDANLFDVTKIEDSRNPDPLRLMKPTKGGISVSYRKINKGKNIVQINLRTEKGKDALRKIISESDVLVESFIAGRLQKLGFGFEDCLALNKSIIYCSISGFGKGHPMSGQPAHDINILGYCGYLVSKNKLPNIPTLPLADMFTSYKCALEITHALLKKERGVQIHVSMLDSVREAMYVVS